MLKVFLITHEGWYYSAESLSVAESPEDAIENLKQQYIEDGNDTLLRNLTSDFSDVKVWEVPLDKPFAMLITGGDG